MKTAREKFKTLHGVFDEFTNRNIMKLISEDHIKGLLGPVSVGKESNVFAALSPYNQKLILKIYRLETSDFNRMYDYLKYDPRYLSIKRNRRQIVFSWAQREYRNLLIARDSSVRVPTPLALKYNILVMEFIGDSVVAPMLKDKSPKDPAKFLSEVVVFVRNLYKAGFVHSDLSSFNILNWNDHPVLIDFSTCTPLKNPRAIEFLKRDVLNLVTFFQKLGLKPSFDLILKKITG
ncbi:MAG: serine protein kinase RIO [Candidatus Woesearchaeota archaeon]